jgi:hypothetical protein
MRHRRAIISVASALAVLLPAACGGDADKATTSPSSRDGVEAPKDAAPPSNAAGQLPPEFLRCMADRGFDIDSPAEVHSASPEALQACFQSLHGAGAP